MSNGGDSRDNIPAQPGRYQRPERSVDVNVNQLLSDLLQVSHNTAAAIGVMQGEQRATRQLIEEMRAARNRDDEGLKDKHRDTETRMRELEKHAVTDVELDQQAAEADAARKELRTELVKELADLKVEVGGLARWKFWVIGAAVGAGAAAAALFELIKFGAGAH